MLPFKGKIKVTSGFRTPQRSNHGGIDLVGIESKEILSVTDGIVTIAATQTGKSASYGNLVVVNYGGNRYFYAHMSKIDVKLGDKIKAGDKLGIMGATGNTTGAHLHFEVRNSKNVRIDPTSFIPPIKNEKGIYMGDTAQKKQESAVSNAVYIVQKGDTLSAIAKKFSTTWKELALINGIKNPNLIFAGQELTVPRAETTTTATAEYYTSGSYKGVSIVDALKSIGVDSSMTNRRKIAVANGITGYIGTATQNLKLLELFKTGKLRKI